jgi:hypothetical protein
MFCKRDGGRGARVVQRLLKQPFHEFTANAPRFTSKRELLQRH